MKIIGYFIWLIIAFLFVVNVWIWCGYEALGFEVKEVYKTIITSMLGIGTLLSVVVLVKSTIQANDQYIESRKQYIESQKQYIESKKPQLLIQVKNPCKNNPRSIHFFYKNVTRNKFKDLTLSPFLCIEGKKYLLKCCADKTEMVMTGFDYRTLTIDFLHEFDELGINLEQAKVDNTEIYLHIRYEYTFSEKKEIEDLQIYKWDYNHSLWNLA